MPDTYTIDTNSIDAASIGFSRLSSCIDSLTINCQSEYKYIKPYNYVPNYIFSSLNEENCVYLGAEIEIDSGGKDDEKAKRAIEILGETNVFAKHDGSLSAGFELVTHPKTLEYHRTLPYADLFKYLVKEGYRSHNTTTCGLHIHISRSYFGKTKIDQDLGIGKLLYLCEKYWNKIVLIARRDSNQYARRFGIDQDDTPIDLYAKSKSSNKYGAINLQHKDTVEFRIFKGTLNPVTYLCTLEFVKDISKIAIETDIYNIQCVTWDDIHNTFSEDLKEYIRQRKDRKYSEKEAPERQIIQPIASVVDMDLSRLLSFYTSSITHEINQTPTLHHHEPTEEQQVRHQMQDLERLASRERNPLAQRNIRREIGHLANEINRLRRQNRN